MAERRHRGDSSKMLRRTHQPRCPTRRLVRLGAAGCVATAVLLSVPQYLAAATSTRTRSARPASLCTHRRIHSGSLNGRVRITTIRNGAKVPTVVNPLRGTYQKLAPTTRLWIFVWSNVAERFYPQTDRVDQPANLQNGRFQSLAAFGGASGEHYEVGAVLATPGASRVISRTLRRWHAIGRYPGWVPSAIPSGLEEKHCVPVVLR
jgi:hypothetical protein